MFITQKCPYINCYITYNKTFIDSEYFDAVVFEAREIFHVKIDNFNLTRSPDQKYIFKSLEPSEYLPVCHGIYDSFFNWTWTYKLNSDITHTFINIYNDKDKLIGPDRNLNWISKMNRTEQFTNVVKRKTKAVAWFIGKCKVKSKHREFIDDLIKELKAYNYTIDTFGPCGRTQCEKGQNELCHKTIESDYYFQLVLEESTSEDFVTERLAKVLSYLTIPIVSGEVDYGR
ncbi:alpha-(1,3)-fucosyltransferase C-like [Hyposmocoma kahamanoa]|uniref:alpha-(1,3)-fucosyltransferase C-like n=1 Tax=Hyposmocoma kahamanoa TaxID=1477025 RepID=UPI000E6D848F|nr:alpha-(1,3)-fucosyltransferase C-like [Hyposmocoma kahamanoa]